MRLHHTSRRALPASRFHKIAYLWADTLPYLFDANLRRVFWKLAKRHRKEDARREVSGKHGRHHENSSLHLCAVIPSNIAAKLEFFVTYANFPFGTTGALHPLPSHLIPFSSPGSGELNFSARRDWRTQTRPILSKLSFTRAGSGASALP